MQLHLSRPSKSIRSDSSRVRLANSVLVCIAGATFGAATSVINDVSSAYGLIGRHLIDTGWASVAGFASKLIGAGWAWVALAVAAGWLANTHIRASAHGAAALLTATTAYYGIDSLLWDESSIGQWHGIVLWCLASVIGGPVLGLVGATIKRPGVIGLLAKLALPAVATVDMLVRSSGNTLTPTMNAARIVVWSVAAIVTGVVFVRAGAKHRGLISNSRSNKQ